jgi:hypothetical protein
MKNVTNEILSSTLKVTIDIFYFLALKIANNKNEDLEGKVWDRIRGEFVAASMNPLD